MPCTTLVSMRIAHVVPGSGDAFYCENCLRDTALVKAQRILGHSVVMAPLYLPVGVDRVDAMDGVDGAPVFYGALNTYLAEKVPVWDRMPRWVRHVLDAPWLLGFAASLAGSTRARGLEQMTLSMLRGEEGRQARELDRLVAWLRETVRPDIVHLSNALLLGLARRIRQELHVPIVCSLQDEDTWVDAMAPPSAARVWKTMASRTGDVDHFFPVSEYYAGLMRGKLGLAVSRLSVVHLGIELDDRPQSNIPSNPPVIGFLSRMCESLGLGVLVDAFIALKREPGFGGLKLRAMGSRTGTDTTFIKQMLHRAQEAGVDADIEILPTFERKARRREREREREREEAKEKARLLFNSHV